MERSFLSGIFKSYDIRGIYGKEINEGMAYRIGRAFVVFLKCSEVVVGMDMRLSSESLFDALSRGIAEQGADVISIGLASTPMLYYASQSHEAGIIITASHNPSEYNGFKLVGRGAFPISGDTGIAEIQKLAEEGSFPEPSRKGSIRKQDIMQDYISYIRSFMAAFRKMRVCVDAGNGMVGYTFPKIFPTDRLDYIPMYFEPDGSFPNHEADPMKEKNLDDLKKKVVEEKADFGVAFDGDGDRICFVDENGRAVPADRITALVAAHLLKKDKGAVVLYDLRSSWSTRDAIEQAGGKAVMCRVGHSHIKLLMRKHKAIFAGELSGHYFLRDNSYAENSEIILLLMLKIISDSGKTLSGLVEPLNRYFASGEINFRVEDKEKIMEALAAKYSSGRVSRMDGIHASFDDWWFNVRPSNTEPLLRLNMEARTKDTLESRKKDIVEIIESG